MNSSPPPAGPLSERVCRLIKEQAHCVLGLGPPTSLMSNWDSRGDGEVATIPLLFFAEPRAPGLRQAGPGWQPQLLGKTTRSLRHGSRGPRGARSSCPGFTTPQTHRRPTSQTHKANIPSCLQTTKVPFCKKTGRICTVEGVWDSLYVHSFVHFLFIQYSSSSRGVNK